MPNDDNDVVHRTGDEEINGIKTISSVNPTIHLKFNDIQQGDSSFTGERYGSISFYDKNDTRIGYIRQRITSGDGHIFDITLPSFTTDPSASIGIESKINGGASLRPGSGQDNKMTLGTSPLRWKVVYSATSTINTSDERLKSTITSVPDEVLDAWENINFIQYKFNDSISEKGSAARFHNGLVAQNIDRIFKANNLDASRYGLFCYDEWNATPEEKDKDGNLVQSAIPAGNRYSLRYEEALCMEAAYQRRRASRAEARISELELRLNSLEEKLVGKD